VQQTTALVWKDITPLELMAVALPIASLLAMASWTLIEQPALRLKSLGQRRSATAERTPAPVVVTRS
jgi:peptidoglycan/LPS O-acetylase OafA/YrhL